MEQERFLKEVGKPLMAGDAGLEPATSGSGGQRSVHLS